MLFTEDEQWSYAPQGLKKISHQEKLMEGTHMHKSYKTV